MVRATGTGSLAAGSLHGRMASEDTRPGTPVDEAASIDVDAPGGTLVHLPVDRAASGREDPARSRRRGRVGPLRAHAGTGPDALRPDLPVLVPGRMGGPREDPEARWCPAGGQPRRGHSLRRPRDHARHRDRAATGPSTAWPTTCSSRLPVVGTLWSRVGGVVAHPDNAYRLLRDKRAAGSRVPRGDQGHGQARFASATTSGASAGAASSRSPCGPACRSSRSPWSAPRRPCRSSPSSTPSPRPSASPTSRSPPQMLALGPLGLVDLTARQVQPAGAGPDPLRRPRRPGALQQEQVMDAPMHIRQRIQDQLFDMLRTRRSVWKG